MKKNIIGLVTGIAMVSMSEALDIGIGWNTSAQRVDISTTQGYDKPSREEMLPIDYLGTTMDDRRKQCDGLLLYGLVRRTRVLLLVRLR